MIRTLLAGMIMAICLPAFAQDIKKPTVSKQFMQINTVESVLAGGVGRSRIIITNADGTQVDSEMENLFSMTGINFKNIKTNESKILTTIKHYTDEGWKLEFVTPLTLSQNDTGGGGIFMTRYLLSKEAEKKGS